MSKILSDQMKINGMTNLIKRGGISKSTAELLLRKQGVKSTIIK